MQTPTAASPSATSNGVLRAWIGGISYAIVAVTTLLLALTGLGSWLLNGRVTGFALIVHVGTGAVFLVAIAIAAACGTAGARRPPGAIEQFAAGGALLAALALGVTMLSALSGFAGPDGISQLTLIHRCSAFVFLPCAAVQFACAVIRRARRT